MTSLTISDNVIRKIDVSFFFFFFFFLPWKREKKLTTNASGSKLDRSIGRARILGRFSQFYFLFTIKKKRNDRFTHGSSPSVCSAFYKNLQRQRRRRIESKSFVESQQQAEEPFISVSVTLYLNCSFTSCAMKALSSVLIVVGPPA